MTTAAVLSTVRGALSRVWIVMLLAALAVAPGGARIS
jgi:hypothetical protein